MIVPSAMRLFPGLLSLVVLCQVAPACNDCGVVEEIRRLQARGRTGLGAVIGGVVGGILGHQIGGGSGKALATVGGLAGGAAIGANVGRNDQPVTNTRDVRRCEKSRVSPDCFGRLRVRMKAKCSAISPSLGRGPPVWLPLFMPPPKD